MFKEDIKTVFPLLKELYDLDGLILVGSDVALWKELSEQTNIENVHYVNIQEQKQISFPSEWHIHEQLLAKDDGIVSYYDLSNSQLSGTLPSEVLTTLWRNLKTVDIREKKALSLETFMSKVSVRKNALIANSFDAVDIVQESAGVEVVIAATIEGNDESLTHYSKNALDNQMKKLGYKLVALLEDKHPQVFLAVYALDIEKQKETLSQQIQEEREELETLNAALQIKIQESEKLAQEQVTLKEEKQKVVKELEIEKENAAAFQKEKEELNKTLQNKNSEVETLRNELKTKTEALSNSLEQEKQNTVNLKIELDTLNAALQIKTQESEKLAQEQAALKEEKQKVAEALETEKTNAAAFQKEKEELNKTLQNKNSEVETLKNELKTKTEALTKSLEQEKQNTVNLKIELDTLNAALQIKTQESEKLAQEQVTLKEEKQKVTQALKAERDLKNIDASSSLKEDIERVSESFEIQVSSIIKRLDKKHTKEKIFLEKIKQEKKLVRRSLKLLREKEKSINSILTNLKQLKGKLFIDCGGYDGCSAIKFLLKNPGYDVITFEPNPEMWDYYKDIPTKLIEEAVMHYDGVVDFTIDPIDGDGSSVIKEKKIDIKNRISNEECPTLLVSCINLSSFIKKQSRKYSEIVLKLDIEGAEYQVIQKLFNDGTLDLISKIYAEFHWEKIGLEKSVHDQTVALIKNKLVRKEWDSLEFAIHKREKFTHKIRKEILEHILIERGK